MKRVYVLKQFLGKWDLCYPRSTGSKATNHPGNHTKQHPTQKQKPRRSWTAAKRYRSCQAATFGSEGPDKWRTEATVKTGAPWLSTVRTWEVQTLTSKCPSHMETTETLLPKTVIMFVLRKTMGAMNHVGRLMTKEIWKEEVGLRYHHNHTPASSLGVMWTQMPQRGWPPEVRVGTFRYITQGRKIQKVNFRLFYCYN